MNLPDTLSVFARIIATEADSRKPYLVYLQGGPGVEAPRPGIVGGPGGWVKRALEEFQVVMLDQRGTGKSSPIGSVDGAITGLDTVGADPAAIAEALSYFRADSIVEDAEILRGHLGADTWSLLGQSFGGFTTLRYISAHSSALNEVFFTGGLPAIGLDPATVYGRTWEGMIRKSEQYYTAFPGDREKMRRLVELASVGEGLALPGEHGRHRSGSVCSGTSSGPPMVRRSCTTCSTLTSARRRSGMTLQRPCRSRDAIRSMRSSTNPAGPMAP